MAGRLSHYRLNVLHVLMYEHNARECTKRVKFLEQTLHLQNRKLRPLDSYLVFDKEIQCDVIRTQQGSQP